MKRIGVLLSGRGSNFEALADSVAVGRIPEAEIALVVSNRAGRAGHRSRTGSRVRHTRDSVQRSRTRAL